MPFPEYELKHTLQWHFTLPLWGPMMPWHRELREPHMILQSYCCYSTALKWLTLSLDRRAGLCGVTLKNQFGWQH